jgi:hypothetical protein
MKTPDSSDVTCVVSAVDKIKLSAEEAASSVISALDKRYSREDVRKIAEWVHYLSTQS